VSNYGLSYPTATVHCGWEETRRSGTGLGGMNLTADVIRKPRGWRMYISIFARESQSAFGNQRKSGAGTTMYSRRLSPPPANQAGRPFFQLNLPNGIDLHLSGGVNVGVGVGDCRYGLICFSVLGVTDRTNNPWFWFTFPSSSPHARA